MNRTQSERVAEFECHFRNLYMESLKFMLLACAMLPDAKAHSLSLI